MKRQRAPPVIISTKPPPKPNSHSQRRHHGSSVGNFSPLNRPTLQPPPGTRSLYRGNDRNSTLKSTNITSNVPKNRNSQPQPQKRQDEREREAFEHISPYSTHPLAGRQTQGYAGKGSSGDGGRAGAKSTQAAQPPAPQGDPVPNFIHPSRLAALKLPVGQATSTQSSPKNPAPPPTQAQKPPPMGYGYPHTKQHYGPYVPTGKISQPQGGSQYQSPRSQSPRNEPPKLRPIIPPQNATTQNLKESPPASHINEPRNNDRQNAPMNYATAPTQTPQPQSLVGHNLGISDTSLHQGDGVRESGAPQTPVSKDPPPTPRVAEISPGSPTGFDSDAEISGPELIIITDSPPSPDTPPRHQRTAPVSQPRDDVIEDEVLESSTQPPSAIPSPSPRRPSPHPPKRPANHLSPPPPAPPAALKSPQTPLADAMEDEDVSLEALLARHKETHKQGEEPRRLHSHSDDIPNGEINGNNEISGGTKGRKRAYSETHGEEEAYKPPPKRKKRDKKDETLEILMSIQQELRSVRRDIGDLREEMGSLRDFRNEMENLNGKMDYLGQMLSQGVPYFEMKAEMSSLRGDLRTTQGKMDSLLKFQKFEKTGKWKDRNRNHRHERYPTGEGDDNEPMRDEGERRNDAKLGRENAKKRDGESGEGRRMEEEDGGEMNTGEKGPVNTQGMEANQNGVGNGVFGNENIGNMENTDANPELRSYSDDVRMGEDANSRKISSEEPHPQPENPPTNPPNENAEAPAPKDQSSMSEQTGTKEQNEEKCERNEEGGSKENEKAPEPAKDQDGDVRMDENSTERKEPEGVPMETEEEREGGVGKGGVGEGVEGKEGGGDTLGTPDRTGPKGRSPQAPKHRVGAHPRGKFHPHLGGEGLDPSRSPTIQRVEGHEAGVLWMARRGKLLFTACADRRARCYDLLTGTMLQAYDGTLYPITSVCVRAQPFETDSDPLAALMVFTGGADGVVSMYRGNSHMPVRSITLEAGIVCLAANEDLLYACLSNGETVGLKMTHTTAQVRHRMGATHSRSESIGDESGQTQNSPPQCVPTCMQVVETDDSETLIFVGYTDGMVRSYRSTGLPADSFQCEGAVGCLAVYGDHLLVGGEGGFLNVFGWKTGEKLTQHTVVNGGTLKAMAVCEGYVAVGGTGNILHVFQLGGPPTTIIPLAIHTAPHTITGVVLYESYGDSNPLDIVLCGGTQQRDTGFLFAVRGWDRQTLYSCGWAQCTCTYVSSTELHDHLVSQHLPAEMLFADRGEEEPQIPAQCEWVGCRSKNKNGFRSQTLFRRHITSHTGGYRCPYSDITPEGCRVMASSRDLLRHLTDTHGQVACGYRGHGTGAYQNQEKSAYALHGPCAKRFATPQERLVHLHTHVGVFACDKCKTTVRSFHDYVAHMLRHATMCEVCGQEFADTKAFSHHKMTAHPEEIRRPNQKSNPHPKLDELRHPSQCGKTPWAGNDNTVGRNVPGKSQKIPEATGPAQPTTLRDMMARDCAYAMLGLPKGANCAAAKRRYRELAKEWHPDVNQTNPEAREMFMQIKWAYEYVENRARAGVRPSVGTSAFKL